MYIITGYFRSLIYKTGSGREPYTDYVDCIQDRIGAAKIRARVSRAELGHFGDCRSIGGGIIELKIHFGPGYRVYFGLKGGLMIVLCAGDKGSQKIDIRKAARYWKNCQRHP